MRSELSVHTHTHRAAGVKEILLNWFCCCRFSLGGRSSLENQVPVLLLLLLLWILFQRDRERETETERERGAGVQENLLIGF